jgi:mRNA interferase RelE/StbE
LFQVIVSQRARKSFRKLGEHYKRRIAELLLLFQQNPVPSEHYDVKKLKGYADSYRVRIGDFRIIYEIVWESKNVHVLVIEHRKKAYD